MQRRKFLQKITASTAAITLGTELFTREAFVLQPKAKVTANDKVRLGLIGAGIIGHYDMDAALKVDGTELVAVCDLYDGRLEYAREKWGNNILTTRDYREVIARNGIDAVFVCVPDHWHDVIAIEAMKAGKHVYCEKPMIHKIEYGHAMIAAEKASGKVCQVGSQGASSLVTLEAQKQLATGIIGELVHAEAVTDRADARGAWQYAIPTDASPETVDYDRFLGRAPKTAFDVTRFFRWRNYNDYGTGVAGDLFVHNFTLLHTVTGSIGPERIFALGDLNYWKDGRDAYDIVTGMMDYPKTAAHPSFHFFTRVNLADGSGGRSQTRIVGTEGVMELTGNELKIKHFKRPLTTGFGGYDSYTSFSAKQKEAYQKWHQEKFGDATTKLTWGEEVNFKTSDNYDSRYDHMVHFFESVRTGKTCVQDTTFGLRAAAPSLACNLSVKKKKVIQWDPVKMKMVK
jgi:predicted dehydrogenase